MVTGAPEIANFTNFEWWLGHPYTHMAMTLISNPNLAPTATTFLVFFLLKVYCSKQHSSLPFISPLDPKIRILELRFLESKKKSIPRKQNIQNLDSRIQIWIQNSDLRVMISIQFLHNMDSDYSNGFRILTWIQNSDTDFVENIESQNPNLRKKKEFE